MRTLRSALSIIALSCFVAHASARAQQPPPQLSAFLDQTVGLSAKQLASLEQGQPVTKVLRTAIDRDVAVAGIITVDVPRAWFVEHFMTVDRPLRSPTRSLSGVFSTPATASDVGNLALSKNDVKDLKACRPRSCNFKLPASGMAFLSTNVDWNSPNVSTELLQYAREQMAAYVNDYRVRGSEAMIIYDDQPTVKSSDALDGLIAQSPYLYPSTAPFQKYLLTYPAEKLDSVSNMIFWSQDQMPHTRPILTIRQLSIFTPPDPGNVTLVATKQLWADHYLEASLDVLAVIDRSSAAAHESVYLVALRQYRFDNLPNNRLFSIRNRVAGGLRDQAESDLLRVKQTYEQDFHPSDARKPH
ncbi:MAG TPA: hypothetical protein VK636_09005 [Gemmatimonadaceae bacterium]|nr:hypothetical protein [Gemmatimonadaceae bacterium]